jgi:uncharacterized protein YbjT (DUF2867 family)
VILISGANGKTGRAIIPHLVKKGERVRALELPTLQNQLRDLGVEPVVGDLREISSLRAAMSGVQTVYHIPPRLQADELEIGKNMIAAAKAEGVQRFVYHSVIFPHLESVVFHWEKMKVEVEILHSGLSFTIIEPTNYMQNLFWQWAFVEQRDELLLPYSVDQAITWLDLHDFGEAVANVLTRPGHEGATYQLCSTERGLTWREIASLISGILGREVKAKKLAVDEYLKLPLWQGMTPEGMERLVSMFHHYDRYGFRCGNNRVLSMLLERPATAYEQFLQRDLRGLKS